MSNKLPSKETVNRLREEYPAGTRIELISMEDDPYSTLRPGDKGAVSFVDDTGTIHVRWDNGSGLGLVYGVDKYKKNTEPIFETGADAWRDAVQRLGLREAETIGGQYLSLQVYYAHTDGEKQYCREFFAAMYEDVGGLADPAKLVYPFALEKAVERVETSYYHKGRERNTECAYAIDMAISASCYETNHYNLELAAMSVIQQYGFSRMNAVLAHNLQTHGFDGRYSRANKDWADGIALTDGAFRDCYMYAHPILLEDFTKHARELYDAVNAERFMLPGQPESGAEVYGYEIVRSISFDDKRGFAIGLNPDAPSPFVCWQFTLNENHTREFYWGTYADDLAGAVNSYVARVMVHMDGGEVREVVNPLAAAEMTKEQNYNMIDGVINNEKPRLDLTDGQTHEEIAALAPETLSTEKPSVIEQIREAKKAPPAPRKEKDARGMSGPEL